MRIVRGAIRMTAQGCTLQKIWRKENGGLYQRTIFSKKDRSYGKVL